MSKAVLAILLLSFQNYYGTHFCYGLNDGDDLHSSVGALHSVFNTENVLIKILVEYIAESKDEISFVKNILDNIKQNTRKRLEIMINGNTSENSSQLFLDKKFLRYLRILKDHLGKIGVITIEHFKTVALQYNLPTFKDLEGVTLAILRIQEVYGTAAEEIANGVINGIDFRTKFAASDCFRIALKLKELEYHYYAIGWYKMTLKRLEQDGWKGYEREIKPTLVYELLAYSQYAEGSIETAEGAVETMLIAISKNYNNSNGVRFASSLKDYVQNYIDLKSKLGEPAKLHIPKGTLNPFNLTLIEFLKKGCRQKLRKPPKEERHLFCRYEISHDRFLILAPIKVEILSLTPYLVVFHDVIYDSEIEILKELSIDKLERAKVWNDKKGIGEPSLVRTSKFAWFDGKDHSMLNKLDQRITDMTGLTMETSETYQLMNYGIGGHYDIHADFFTEPNEKNKIQPYTFYSDGNRIATVLFYLSDVESGGGTVWPAINVFTTPKKGSAAFWYNLLSDDEPDFRTYHSACPIIVGSKWVLNKWIRARGQIFRRPCNLTRGF